MTTSITAVSKSSKRKTILITGSTAGIGRHAALHLARDGHRVIATGRNLQLLEALAAEAAQANAPLEIVRLDVTDAVSIMAAHAEVLRRTDGAGIDVLINNAGYGLSGPLEEITDADLRAQFDTNVFGLMAVTRAFLPEMRARGAGRVINVASIIGRMTVPFMGAYCATKYAVEALSDALRIELRAAGIDVVLVEPGPIKTEFSERTSSFVDRYNRPESPYAGSLARNKEMLARGDRMAVGPEVITRVLRRAIGARRPAPRYVAPFSSRLMLRLVLLLPTRLVDFVMRASLGLNQKALPPASAAPADGRDDSARAAA